MTDIMERVKGIEPSPQAWEAGVLPLNYTRISDLIIISYRAKKNQAHLSLHHDNALCRRQGTELDIDFFLFFRS